MKDLEYDVVIIGGGPAGSMAAIASGRHGLSTLLVERGSCLGGMLTTAGVGPQMSFHAGKTKVVRGIADELVSLMQEKGFSPGHIDDPIGYASSITPFDAEGMKVVLEDMALDANVQILYHTVFTGCATKDGKIESVKLFSKNGFFDVKAKVFIDCSADADLSVSAGIKTDTADETQPMTMNVKVYGVDTARLADYAKTHRDDMLETTLFDQLDIIPRFAFQGAESRIKLAKANGDFNVERSRVLCFETNNRGEYIINMSHVHDLSATDPFDLTKAEIQGRKEAFEIVNFLRKYIPGFENCILHSTGGQIGIRESRRIIGRHVLTSEELVTNTMFHDAIAMGGYPIDVHRKGDFWVEKTYSLKKGSWYSIPYSSLVTNEVSNLIVAGRCISMDHMACGAVRVTPIVMAIGQAAGCAAYESITSQKDANAIDTNILRRTLVADGAFLEEWKNSPSCLSQHSAVALKTTVCHCTNNDSEEHGTKAVYKELMCDGQIKGEWVQVNSIREFDSNGNEIHWVSGDGSGESWSDYDSKGNPIHTRYSNGSEFWFEYEYDAQGNPIHSQSSDGCETWFEYDAQGNQIHSWSSDGCERWNEYDSNGNDIHRWFKDGPEAWYEYDVQGNPILCRGEDGSKCWLEYDSNGNEIHQRWDDGTERWTEYEYWPNKKIKKATEYTKP